MMRSENRRREPTIFVKVIEWATARRSRSINTAATSIKSEGNPSKATIHGRLLLLWLVSSRQVDRVVDTAYPWTHLHILGTLRFILHEKLHCIEKQRRQT